MGDSGYAHEDESVLGGRAEGAIPLPETEAVSHNNEPRSPQTYQDSGIPGGQPEYPVTTLDDFYPVPLGTWGNERPTTPVEDSRALLTRLTSLQPRQLEAFPDELPPLPLSRQSSPDLPSLEPKHSSSLAKRRLSSTSVSLRFRAPPRSPDVQRDLILDLKHSSSPANPPLHPPRPRHTKSSSGNCKNGREYRPLYLVARNLKSAEIEEVLPALPSSGSPSGASSTSGAEDEY